MQADHFAPNRRALMTGALALGTLGAAAATPAGRAFAQAQVPSPATGAGVITRRIPKTGEAIPALGLGTYLTFDLLPGAPRDHLEQVTRTYWDAGVRTIDTSPLYGSGEISLGAFLAKMNATNDAFITNKIWSTGEFLADDSHALRSLTQSQSRLWRDKIDVMQCHSLVNVDVIVPLIKAWKKEQRVRYVGVSHNINGYHDLLIDWIRRGDLDFVQVNYSIANHAGEKVLEAAAANNVAVLINMPVEKGRLHAAAGTTPLPDIAREIGAQNWSEYFLKWVIGHPAVTCALCATSNPAHAAENVRALRGELPDAAMRQRMVKELERFPAFAEVLKQRNYPGKNYPGLIGRAQADIRARS